MNDEKLKVVSLFSGIGGFEEGLRISKIPASVVFPVTLKAVPKSLMLPILMLTIFVATLNR